MAAANTCRLLRDALTLITLSAVPALLSGWLHPNRPQLILTRPTIAELTREQIGRLNGPVLWVDARSAQAYNANHIPGAVLCNEDHWEQQLPNLLAVWQPGTTLIVYCDSTRCSASQSIALRLQRELSLPDPIYVLQGGWATWQAAPR